MADWSSFDSGAAGLVLVGPVLRERLSREKLAPLGLEGAPQIAVDGGIHYAASPLLWAGDGDSGERPEGAPVFFKHAQDETDLRFCLNGVRNWAWKELHLFGFLGARRDHELANLGEIHAELKARPGFTRALFYDAAYNWQIACLAGGAHEIDIHGGFSVLALEETKIDIGGAAAYQGRGLALAPLSGHGVSNHAKGIVTLAAAKPFMVLRASYPS